MARRSLQILFTVIVVTILCYREASSRRSHPLAETLIETFDQIEQKYIEEIPRRELLEAALDGIMDRLDEHSAFIGPEHFTAFQENLDQKFGGVGISVSLDPETKTLVVMSPLVGTPAYHAGILAGDKIVSIEGQDTKGFRLKDAVKLLRGDPGEAVRLSVLHEGAKNPVELVIVRAIIKVPTILGDVREDDLSWNFLVGGDGTIGYIRMTSFGEETVEELRAALSWLTKHGMQALILDLRDNPGGLLTAATETCDLFIEKGLIVSTRGRGGRDARSHTAVRKGTYSGFPMAVLINQFSASASEIVAACLQDHRRAVAIGQRTWGKGSVQNVIPLEGGRSALKLTTATYWRPSGKNIHRTKDAKKEDQWGVMPDEGFLVEVDTDEYVRRIQERRKRDFNNPNNPDPAAPDAKPTTEGQDTVPDEPGGEDPGAVDANQDVGAAEEAAEADDGKPFVDRQMQKAVEFLKEKLRNTDEKPAAA